MCIIISCVLDSAVPELLKSMSVGKTYTQKEHRIQRHVALTHRHRRRDHFTEVDGITENGWKRSIMRVGIITVSVNNGNIYGTHNGRCSKFDGDNITC